VRSGGCVEMLLGILVGAASARPVEVVSGGV